jgi:hypothetical protein
MCQRCLELQDIRNAAGWRLYQAEKAHGGSIPANHPDIKYLAEAERAYHECQASFRRHSQNAEHPTCAICDGPAAVYDEVRHTMVCIEHIVPWARITSS